LWVAAADGEISQLETKKFLSTITDSKALDLDYTQEINDIFLDTRDHFSHSFEEAAKEAQERVAEFKSNAAVSQLILTIARRGVVANEAIKEQEEFVLKQIADSLGINNP